MLIDAADRFTRKLSPLKRAIAAHRRAVRALKDDPNNEALGYAFIEAEHAIVYAPCYTDAEFIAKLSYLLGVNAVYDDSEPLIRAIAEYLGDLAPTNVGTDAMSDSAPLVAALRRRFRLAETADDSALLHELLRNTEIRVLLMRKARMFLKQAQSASKHPPEALVEWAKAFAEFKAQAEEDAKQRELGKPMAAEMRERFLENSRDRFPWLPKKQETLARLLHAGRKYAMWPRAQIDGEPRILHPDQAAALALLESEAAASMDFEARAALRAELLALRPDRRNDPERMRAIRAEIAAGRGETEEKSGEMSRNVASPDQADEPRDTNKRTARACDD